MTKIQSNNYLYLITYRREFKSLCNMEMKYIFGNTDSDLHHFTNQDLPLNRSTFLKGRIAILYKEKTIEEIEQKIIDQEVTFDGYKIQFIKLDKVEYKDRLQAMRVLGTAIEGDFAIKDPNISLALTYIDGFWVFGHYEQNEQTWQERRKKPFNYSHALEVKLAKSIINIAIHNDFTLKLVDPCCGIGTILIEALSSNIDIDGYELIPLVSQHANTNLTHFGLEPIVKNQDMKDINKHYDVAILDLPYGQFSSITRAEQIELITNTKNIASKAVIITMEDMSDIFESVGYKIEDKCRIEKSNAFSRYITVCV